MTISTDTASGWRNEEKLIKYLLKWYQLPGLANLQIEHIEDLVFPHPEADSLLRDSGQAIPPGKRLTLRAWDRWTEKKYPDWLHFRRVTLRQASRMKPHLAKHPEKTLLWRDFYRWRQYKMPRPYCTVYHFPYQRDPAEYLAVHNLHSRNGHSVSFVSGDYRICAVRERHTMVLQSLRSLLGLIDRNFQTRAWAAKVRENIHLQNDFTTGESR